MHKSRFTNNIVQGMVEYHPSHNVWEGTEIANKRISYDVLYTLNFYSKGGTFEDVFTNNHHFCG